MSARHSSNSQTAEAKVGLVSRLERAPGTTATHSLQTKSGLNQQACDGARDSSNSQSAKPRVGLVSRLERVPGIAATHKLQSQKWA